MKLRSFLVPEAVVTDLEATDKKGVIRELVQALARAGAVGEESFPSIVQSMLAREKMGSTGIGRGVAIPHSKSKAVDKVVCAFGRSRVGADFASIDGEPVDLVFLEVSPADPMNAKEHLKALQRICEILRNEMTCRFLREADGVAEILDLLFEADDELGA